VSLRKATGQLSMTKTWKKRRSLVGLLIVGSILVSVINFGGDQVGAGGEQTSTPFLLTTTNPLPAIKCNGLFSFGEIYTGISNVGLPSELEYDGKTILKSMGLTVTNAQLGVATNGGSQSCTEGTRWLYGRVETKVTLKDEAGPICSCDSYIESVKGSPRVFLYVRFTFLRSVRSLDFKFDLNIPGEYTTCGIPSSTGLKTYETYENKQPIDLGRGTFSYAFFDRQSDSGLGIELPLEGAEIRTWYKDDYVISKKIMERSTVLVSNAALDLRVDVDSVTAKVGETLDEYFVIVPLSGNDFNPVDYCNYNIYDISETRYFPVEGISTDDYTRGKDYTNLSPDLHYMGYVWGWSTKMNYYFIKLSNYPDSAFHGFVWDQKVIGFERYVETASKYGLIPYTLFPETFKRQTKEPNKYFTDFMFAQSGVACVDFARELVPRLSTGENQQMYEFLSKLKTVFDPSDKMSWTFVLPDGSYWFEYSNLWKSEGHDLFIINTHITALRIAACMHALADSLGDKSDEAFWNNLVVKGTNGLLWFITNPKNWSLSSDGHREIAYAAGTPPHADYYPKETKELEYMITSGLLTYRASEITAALNREGRP
jgi:hypothetical protein